MKKLLIFLILATVLIQTTIATQSNTTNFRLNYVVSSGVWSEVVYPSFNITSVAGESLVGNVSHLSFEARYGLQFNFSEIGDITPPKITTLTNISTLTTSAILQLTCSESCNYTMFWWNNTEKNITFFVDSISTLTKQLTHTPTISSLNINTSYYFNVSVWDAAGNTATNNSFNFTTATEEPSEGEPIGEAGGKTKVELEAEFSTLEFKSRLKEIVDFVMSLPERIYPSHPFIGLLILILLIVVVISVYNKVSKTIDKKVKRNKGIKDEIKK